MTGIILNPEELDKDDFIKLPMIYLISQYFMPIKTHHEVLIGLVKFYQCSVSLEYGELDIKPIEKHLIEGKQFLYRMGYSENYKLMRYKKENNGKYPYPHNMFVIWNGK